MAAAIIGATLHAVDGSLNAGGLGSLVRAWEVAAEGERPALVQNADLLLRVLDATWAGVITLFHGVPFVLAGLAVALSRRYPSWLGWVGFIGGARSVTVGVAMFLGAAPAGMAVPFAVILSVFMLILGWLMWGSQTAGWIRHLLASQPERRSTAHRSTRCSPYLPRRLAELGGPR